ncbi:hypothetical protein ACWEQL_00550 [Kitasatospora sp. NPDC004240]
MAGGRTARHIRSAPSRPLTSPQFHPLTCGVAHVPAFPGGRAYIVELLAVAYVDAPDDASARDRLREKSEDELHTLDPRIPETLRIGDVALAGLAIQSTPTPLALEPDDGSPATRPPQELSADAAALFAAARDGEADTLVDVAIRAGLLWRCPGCANTNPRARGNATSASCITP